MRLIILLLSLILSLPVMALNNSPDTGYLNQVMFRLTAEQWVSSKTALVTIGINAGVSDVGVEKLQTQVLSKLQKISDQGEWHIISMERNQDQSGLEKVQMQAQARLSTAALSGLRDKAKSISQPGETYTLDNLQFSPSEEELRIANANLRASIYSQAKDELERLNKAFPDQKYVIHNIDFVGNLMMAAPMVQNTYMAMKMNQGNAPLPLAVGDKLSVGATVSLASVSDTFLKMQH